MEAKTIHQSLTEIQGKLKAPKGQYNSFGKYKYRSAEDILEAVKPLLKDAGCTLTISDDIHIVANRIYVKAITTLSNKNGESISTTAFAREEESKKGMDASQVTGAASSYARKYALNGLFCIDDNKDADTLNTNEQYTAPQPPPPYLEDALQAIKEAKTTEELSKIWYELQGLQNDKQFVAAISARKKEVQK